MTFKFHISAYCFVFRCTRIGKHTSNSEGPRLLYFATTVGIIAGTAWPPCFVSSLKTTFQTVYGSCVGSSASKAFTFKDFNSNLNFCSSVKGTTAFFFLTTGFLTATFFFGAGFFFNGFFFNGFFAVVGFALVLVAFFTLGVAAVFALGFVTVVVAVA